MASRFHFGKIFSARHPAFDAQQITRDHFDVLAIVINTGTNIPSIPVDFSSLAPLIRLSYGRMVLMAVPYTFTMGLNRVVRYHLPALVACPWLVISLLAGKTHAETAPHARARKSNRLLIVLVERIVQGEPEPEPVRR